MGAALRLYTLVVRTVGAGHIDPYEFRIDAEHLGRDLAVHRVGADADVSNGGR